MKWLWQRVVEIFQDSKRQHVTKIGVFFTLAVVLVGLAAFVSANNLLFLLLAALLATLLISGFVSRLGLAGLELDLVVPEHVAARRPVSARLLVKNNKFLTPSFSLHLSGSENSGLREEIYLPLVPPRTELNEPVELYFARRGIYKENTFCFASRFPFGFTHRRAQLRLSGEVLVYPCIDPQPEFEVILAGIAGEIESRQRGRGNDFYRIRPYQALESSRHVDWRATAHTGELQVREFARDQDQAVTLFLDLHVAFAHLGWFDRAVDCCAFLVWHLNDKGTPLRFLTQRFDRRVPEEASVYDILRYLALVEPAPGAKPISPDEHNFSIAITARPDVLAEAGWLGTPFDPPELPPSSIRQ